MKQDEKYITNRSQTCINFKKDYEGRHSFNKKLEKGSEDEDMHMVGRCCVCSDDKCISNNLIVFCDGCNVAVHMDCYGIMNVSANTEWFCRRCEFEQKNETKHEQIVIYFYYLCSICKKINFFLK